MAHLYQKIQPIYKDVQNNTRRVLASLPDAYHVAFEFNLNEANFDALVVSATGVYVVEVKNLYHAVTELENHNWLEHNPNPKELPSPLPQVQRAASLLQDYLRVQAADILVSRKPSLAGRFWSEAPIYRIVCVPRWHPESAVHMHDGFTRLAQCSPDIREPEFLPNVIYNNHWHRDSRTRHLSLSDAEISALMRKLGLVAADEATAIPGSLWRPNIDTRAAAGFKMGIRSDDIRAIGDRLDGYPLLAFVGEPKIGKTSLAQQVAANFGNSGRSVLYHDFRLDSPVLMLERFLEKTRIPLRSSTDDNIAAFVVELCDQPWTVVLDNFETKLDKKSLTIKDKVLSSILERLLSSASSLHSRVLLTSRYSILTSQGVSIPEYLLQGVSEEAAVPYLKTLYGWSDDEARAIYGIRGGHPHVMHACSIDIQRKMEYGLPFSSALNQLNPETANLYPATFEGLEGEEKSVVRYAALHPNGISIAALQWLKGQGLLPSNPIDLVIRLSHKLALHRAEDGSVYLLPQDQSYVADNNDQREQQNGHLARYFRTVVDIEKYFSESVESYDRLFFHSIASDSVVLAWEALVKLGWAEHLAWANQNETLARMTTQIMEHRSFDQLPPAARGDILLGAGVSLCELAELPASEAALNNAESQFALAGDRIKQADATTEIGLLARKKGVSGKDELTYYQMAAGLLRGENSADAKRAQCKCLSRSANAVERDGGAPGTVITYLTKSLELAREIGDLRLVAYRLGQLGAAHRDMRRNYDTAAQFMKEALEIATAVKDQPAIVANLAGLGATYENQGRFPLAQSCYGQALEMTAIGDVYGLLDRLGRLGHVEANLKRYEDSEAYYWRAIELARRVDNSKAEAENLVGLGSVLRTKANETPSEAKARLLAVALECHLKAVAIQESRSGEPVGRANRYQELGRTLLALDKPVDARNLFVKALGALKTAHDSPRIRRLRAFQFQRLAETLEASNDLEHAAICNAKAEWEFGDRDPRERERAKKRLNRILQKLDAPKKEVLVVRLQNLDRECEQFLKTFGAYDVPDRP